jgi:hypothetical protein
MIFYPCLCLKRGFFLLIIYNFPLRRTILQSTLRFFMDALTFMTIFLLLNFAFLLIPVYDPATAQIIRAHFNAYFISRQNTDIVHTHFTRNCRQDLMAIL